MLQVHVSWCSTTGCLFALQATDCLVEKGNIVKYPELLVPINMITVMLLVTDGSPYVMLLSASTYSKLDHILV